MHRETADDLAKKFQGTFAWCNKTIMYIHNFSEDNNHDILAKLLDCNGYTTVVKVEPNQIEPIPVKIGFFNLSPDTVSHFKKANQNPILGTWCMSRHPRRSPSSGVTDATYKLDNPLTRKIVVPVTQFSAGFDTLRDNQKWEFSSLATIFNEINTLYCRAWSPQYMVSVSPTKEPEPLLAHRFGFIGRFTDPDRLKIYHTPSYQEVRDFVERTNQPVSVSVCPVRLS